MLGSQTIWLRKCSVRSGASDDLGGESQCTESLLEEASSLELASTLAIATNPGTLLEISRNPYLRLLLTEIEAPVEEKYGTCNPPPPQLPTKLKSVENHIGRLRAQVCAGQ